MSPPYNLKNSAVKRILQEAKELGNEQSNEYEAHPLDDNIFEWHFTVMGPMDTDFEGGRYHGRILLPAEYPFKPPHLIFLTPNGRFELNTKVCLSITDHHPEFWQPAWGIRTVLLAVIGFFPTTAQGAVGGLDYPKDERQRLAKLSKDWKCPVCQVKNDDFIQSSAKPRLRKEEDTVAFTFTMPDLTQHDPIADTPSASASASSTSTSMTSSTLPSALTTDVHETLLPGRNDQKDHPLSSQTGTHCSSSSPSLSASPSLLSLSSSASQRAQLHTTLPPPPLWLDALIGLCVTALLYILYRKFI